MGMLEDSMLYSLNSEVDELKEKLRKANLRIKELEEINLKKHSDEYKKINEKYSSKILKTLKLGKEYIKTLNDITSSKEYMDNKLCDKCDFNNYDYDIEKITKNYCPFAPICEIDIGEDFDIDEIIKIIEENK